MTREEAQLAWEGIVDLGFSDYEKLSREQRVWFNIEPLTTDGLIDHYVNYGAEHNADTIEDLEYLGFNDIANLMRNFNQLFPNEKPPIDIDERNELLGEFDEELVESMDEKFWARCDDIEDKLLEHINETGIGKMD